MATDDIEIFETRRRCRVPRCREERGEGVPFCEEHWDQVPDDLQIRVQWAYDDGSTLDIRAAIRAAAEAIRDPTQ